MGSTACYFQFNSPQLGAQAQFLSRLFDWEINTDSPDHAFFDHRGSEGAISGDIETSTETTPTGLILYWQVDDLEATCALAVELGGEVLVAPNELPNNHGSIALIKDLDGNTLGLYRVPAST